MQSHGNAQAKLADSDGIVAVLACAEGARLQG
jgi:hypothetical protein